MDLAFRIFLLMTGLATFFLTSVFLVVVFNMGTLVRAFFAMVRGATAGCFTLRCLFLTPMLLTSTVSKTPEPACIKSTGMGC